MAYAPPKGNEAVDKLCAFLQDEAYYWSESEGETACRIRGASAQIHRLIHVHSPRSVRHHAAESGFKAEKVRALIKNRPHKEKRDLEALRLQFDELAKNANVD